MEMKDRIREARKKKGITQKQLAEIVGVRNSSVCNWEKGLNRPDPDTIELICGALDVTPAYILGMDETDTDILTETVKRLLRYYRMLDDAGKELLVEVAEHEVQRVRTEERLKAYQEKIYEFNNNKRLYTYFNRIACAGKGFVFDDIPIDTVAAEDRPDADYIIGVNGDSMEPTYRDGDKVYVKKTDTIQIGEIGIFIYRNECYIKERGKDGLISHNKSYPDIPGTEDIQCVGKVLGLVK